MGWLWFLPLTPPKASNVYSDSKNMPATQMLGQPDSPPRSEGKLLFSEDGNARCLVWRWRYPKRAISNGEDFRHKLIHAIAAWEKQACTGQSAWTITSTIQRR